MVGETSHANPTVHVPPWALTTSADDPTVGMLFSPTSTGNANFTTNGGDDYPYFLHSEALAALQRYLPSNTKDVDFDDSDGDVSGKDLDLPVDAYSCDHFRMFEFKVRKCARGRSHDWTECPYAHTGEKARRRDPRKYHYSGTACPDFRKGNCKKGDACEFAHGVFECWLHPARYRTQPCKDGVDCRRRVCFFAHTLEQLRIPSHRTPASGSTDSYDVSPQALRFGLDGSFAKMLPFISSSESSSPPSESPPLSPMTGSLSRSLGSHSINEMVASLRQLQLNKVKSMPSSWAAPPRLAPSGLGSPRMPMTRPGFFSLPTTPTRAVTRQGIGYFDAWDADGGGCKEEPVMERVESGRDLRTRMFEKLSMENPLDRAVPNPLEASNPDLGWVSDLVQ